MHALAAWLAAEGITPGLVVRRVWLPNNAQPGEPPPLPQLGSQAIAPSGVAESVKARAAEAGSGGRDFGGHSLKSGALTTRVEPNVRWRTLSCSAGTRAPTCSGIIWSLVTYSSAIGWVVWCSHGRGTVVE